MKTKIFSTSHAKSQYQERFGLELSEYKFPKEIKLWACYHHHRKYYYNLEGTGFFVLKRDPDGTYVIVTTALEGKINDKFRKRNYRMIEVDYRG